MPTAKNLIPEIFNEYFVNVGYNINRTFVPGRKNIGKYITKNKKSAFFKPISPDEIIDIVKNFKNNTSPGSDGIEVCVLKGIIDHVCEPLSAIFNKCLDAGIFPDKLKIARVIPVFKKGSTEILSNYRPISVCLYFPKKK